MRRRFPHYSAVGLVIIFAVVGGGYMWFGDFLVASSESLPVPVYGNVAMVSGVATTTASLPKRVVKHLPTPEPLKAVYMTSWVTSTPSLRERVINLIDETEVNAVVIDIKDDTGKVAYLSEDPLVVKIGSAENRIRNLEEIIDELHRKNIYVIGRVAVFQDPYLAQARPDLAIKRSVDGAVWKDRKGLSWVDPSSREVWNYVMAIAKEAHALGFDEINFDYVRFPSDGDLRNLSYPHTNLASTTRPAVIKSFFAHVNKTLKPLGMPISADIFGMTTTAQDDMNIGQILENALPYFDYVAPMVYPSHYPPHFAGFADPNQVPYEIVKHAMSEGVRRAKLASTTPSKLRPWIQDFDYPVPYSADDVIAQKKAVYDSGLTSWMMWAPSNVYTREAYLTE